jgi:HSP20 family protein
MTTLVEWSPVTDLDSMERRLRRAFEGIGFLPAPLPAADIYETESEFVVELEVPGYEEKELAVEVFDHTVHVKGERTEATEDEEKSFHLRERRRFEFGRRFRFPAQADMKHVRAGFENGVLELHAPKLADSKPQKIKIGEI